MRELTQVLTDNGVDLTGWTLDQGASAVSADGLTIVGDGIDPLGRRQAWIATIPEPGTPLLLLTALLVLARRARRQL